MRCLDKNELRKLLKMDAGDEFSAAYEHVCSCEQCRTTLRKLAGCTPAAVGLAESILSIDNCPEYEELSAFVNGDLDPLAASAMQAHLNSCEMCAADIERISELRAHASLRETIEVRPSVGHAATGWPLIRRVLGGLVTVGAAAAIVMALLPGVKTPIQKPDVVAVTPPNVTQPATPTTPDPTKTDAEVKPVAPAPAPSQLAASPAYKVVLVDGRYQVAKLNGKLVVLKSGDQVTPPRVLMTKMAQKISTGKVAVLQPVAMAMTAIRVRGPEGYVPPPTAPKLEEPVGKVLLSNRPALRWSGTQLAHSYRVTIKDTAGNTVHDTTTTRTHAVSAKLPRGQVYTWQVGVRFNENDEWTLSSAAKFKVLSDQDMAILRQASKSLPGSHLALGVAYESLGLSDEAAREYRLLHKANPRVRF